MRLAIKRIGLFIGLSAAGAVAYYAVQVFHDQDLSRYVSVRSLWAITIATAFYLSIIPISAWAWRLLLSDVGVARPWRELVEIMAITQLAKYVPGNVGVHLGRVGMTSASGIATKPVILSMLFETVLAIAAALAVGLVGTMTSGVGVRILHHDMGRGIAIAATAIAAILLTTLVARRWLRAWATRLLRNRGGHASGPLNLRFSTTMRALTAYTANYVFIGVGIWSMATILLPKQHHDGSLLSASFALAWVAGFFTPGAPAGLGVRESLMLGVLGFAYAKTDALVIIVALRLATMAGDAISFLCGYALLAASRSKARAV